MRQAAQVFPEQPAHATEVDVIHTFWCRKARDERRPFAMLERVAGRSIARRELSWLPGEMRAQPACAVDKHIGESFSHGIVSPAMRRKDPGGGDAGTCRSSSPGSHRQR